MAAIVLAAGGTGGHLVPALALAERLSAAGHRVHLVTQGRRVEDLFLERASVPWTSLPLEGGGPGLAWRLGRSVFSCRRLLRREGAGAVVGLGGRVSVPVALAARSLGLPVCLLEQNAVAGRANRLLRPLARGVFLGFPAAGGNAGGSTNGRVVREGAPLGAAFLERAARAGPPGGEEARAVRGRLGLAQDVFTVLVTGGSQGAWVLNQAAPEALGRLGGVVQVVHLTGPGREEEVGARYRSAGVPAVVWDFTRDMAGLYEAADLVVCRGGALTLCELLAVGRGALVVPYPWHRDRHQLHNARALEACSAARVLQQEELTPETLARALAAFLEDPGLARRMGEAARGLHRPEAAERIAQAVAALAEEGRR